MQSPRLDKPKKHKPHKRLGFVFYNNRKGRSLKRLIWRCERKYRRLHLQKELNQELLDLLDNAINNRSPNECEYILSLLYPKP